MDPLRVGQRIDRINRVGQRHAAIRVVNLHYERTVETAVYRALRRPIHLFERRSWGRLQPILAKMPRAIREAVLAGRDVARNVADRIEKRPRPRSRAASTSTPPSTPPSRCPNARLSRSA